MMRSRLAMLAGLGAATTVLLSWFACSGSTEAPSNVAKPRIDRADAPKQTRVAKAPRIQFQPPTRETATPNPITADDPKLAKRLAEIREPLWTVVDHYGRDPNSPWAIAHAMLALGPDMTIPGYGGSAVEYLAENYGQPVPVGTEMLWTFPPRKGRQLVDVHTDMILKGFTEGGLSPDEEVTVAGRPTTLGALYRRSLYRAWNDRGVTGFQRSGWNDAAWALQALTAWAPTHLEYVAENGRTMRLQDMTRGMRETIARETAPLKKARSEGRLVRKDTRQGIFSYTCGGQHALQGLAYAVGRGFGNDADRKEVCDQVDLLGWRIDVELQALDPMIERGGPEIKILLNTQKLKFLGHSLETVHKIAAMGVCELTPERLADSRRTATELARTVDSLRTLRVFQTIPSIAKDPRYDQIRKGGGAQVALDLVGDAAHAVRGIDMATGNGVIRY